MTAFIFFFNDTATTEIYTLSLHDALPICPTRATRTPAARTGFSAGTAALTSCVAGSGSRTCAATRRRSTACSAPRSEEHTSELQSRPHLVCRLLLEKKKNL